MSAKKSHRRRPELETLEAVTLLSTFGHTLAPAVHAPAVHAAATPAITTVALHGTIHATGKLSGTTVAVSGSGNLGAVGSASAKVTVNLLHPPSSITLSAKKGKLVLAEDSPLLTSGNGGSTTYHVASGTGSYAHATGSGTVTATYSLAKGNKVTLNFKFS